MSRRTSKALRKVEALIGDTSSQPTKTSKPYSPLFKFIEFDAKYKFTEAWLLTHCYLKKKRTMIRSLKLEYPSNFSSHGDLNYFSIDKKSLRFCKNFYLCGLAILENEKYVREMYKYSLSKRIVYKLPPALALTKESLINLKSLCKMHYKQTKELYFMSTEWPLWNFSLFAHFHETAEKLPLILKIICSSAKRLRKLEVMSIEILEPDISKLDLSELKLTLSRLKNFQSLVLAPMKISRSAERLLSLQGLPLETLTLKFQATLAEETSLEATKIISNFHELKSLEIIFDADFPSNPNFLLPICSGGLCLQYLELWIGCYLPSLMPLSYLDGKLKYLGLKFYEELRDYSMLELPAIKSLLSFSLVVRNGKFPFYDISRQISNFSNLEEVFCDFLAEIPFYLEGFFKELEGVHNLKKFHLESEFSSKVDLEMDNFCNFLKNQRTLEVLSLHKFSIVSPRPYIMKKLYAIIKIYLSKLKTLKLVIRHYDEMLERENRIGLGEMLEELRELECLELELGPAYWKEDDLLRLFESIKKMPHLRRVKIGGKIDDLSVETENFVIQTIKTSIRFHEVEIYLNSQNIREEMIRGRVRNMF